MGVVGTLLRDCQLYTLHDSLRGDRQLCILSNNGSGTHFCEGTFLKKKVLVLIVGRLKVEFVRVDSG